MLALKRDTIAENFKENAWIRHIFNCNENDIAIIIRSPFIDKNTSLTEKGMGELVTFTGGMLNSTRFMVL